MSSGQVHALPTIADPVMIFGTSQPGYLDRPVIELDGTERRTADKRSLHHDH